MDAIWPPTHLLPVDLVLVVTDFDKGGRGRAKGEVGRESSSFFFFLGGGEGGGLIFAVCVRLRKRTRERVPAPARSNNYLMPIYQFYLGQIFFCGTISN